MVLLRTGVLMHIKKYMQTLGLLPLDVMEKLQAAEPAEEPGSEAEDEAADAGMLQCVLCACCEHLRSCGRGGPNLAPPVPVLLVTRHHEYGPYMPRLGFGGKVARHC